MCLRRLSLLSSFVAQWFLLIGRCCLTLCFSRVFFTIYSVLLFVQSIQFFYFIQGTKIQASILGKALNEKLNGLLEENKTYFISNFEVKENSKDYKATPHEFKLLGMAGLMMAVIGVAQNQ